MTIKEFKHTFSKHIPVTAGSPMLYTIGTTYKKEISRSDKKKFTWQHLANFAGVNWLTGEQFRLWIVNEQRKKGELGIRSLDEKVIIDPAKCAASTDPAELYKEKIKVRDFYTLYRKSLRDEARIEQLKEIIVDAAKALPTLPKVVFNGQVDRFNEVEAILPIADLHLGAEFENSYNKYNIEIAAKRLTKLLEDTIFYCHINHVSKIHVLNMGDMISGKIHPTLRLENMADAISQTMKAAELLANFINELQKAVPEVTYRSVSDNHSRITDDKNQHIEKENLNRIIDWHIETRLAATDVMFMHDNLDIGVGRFVLGNSKKVFFMHGHQDKKTSVMQDMVGLTREFPDYIILAHYHNSAEHTFQGAKVFVCGSIMGTDTYAYGRRLFGEPEQKLLIFDTDNVLDIEIKLK